MSIIVDIIRGKKKMKDIKKDSSLGQKAKNIQKLLSNKIQVPPTYIISAENRESYTGEELVDNYCLGFRL